MNRKNNYSQAVMVLLVAIFAVAVSGGLAWSMGSRVPVVGTPAEDFRLVDLEGKQQSLSQYRGKVVLVNF
ncbi:MAG: peroxiredoxin family protein, partial [Nitrospira sp.]|nr:peroxiredoxin family protein [Nitrospira sp.]